ncbi:MAG: hypothetical protein TYPL_4540 [Candidatus Tyloplasma litorale]|nr:MAG: hypothetical protein TYPL_4540 [Mycoplasmatales bacterium]
MFKNNVINFYKNEQILNKNFKYFSAIKDIKRILKYVSKDFENPLEMSVYICDSKKMRKLNNEHRNIDKSTDVLSFPHNELDNKNLYIGDIFINEDILEEQSKEINSNPYIELKFLVMHGILHLIGYDHNNIAAERKMISKQQEIFKNLKIRKW